MEDVLQAARVGAGWAFERLYTWLAPAVHGYVRGQGARDPEDVTSEVFLTVFRGIAQFEGTVTNFRSWVFTVAYRRMIDERRRDQRRPTSPLESSADQPSASDVEAEALAAAGHAEVLRLLDELTPDQRDVLLLRIVADQSIEQVAATLGKAPGAVKSLQHRALEALRKRISREGVPQ